MKHLLILAISACSLIPLLGGCGEPDYSNGPEAWQKTPVSEKIEKIKKMPLSQQQKIMGINNLQISQEEKDKAIAEIRSQNP